MASTELDYKKGKRTRTACNSCHDSKRKCTFTDDHATSCTHCHERGNPCVRSSTFQAGEKRKNIEIETSSDSEYVRVNRATSSITIVCEKPENVGDEVSVGPTQKRARTPANTRQPSPKPILVKEDRDSDICGLCNKPPRIHVEHKADETMIECDACKVWHHVTCLWFSKKKKKMILFSPETGNLGKQDANKFFCPKCLDETQDKSDGRTKLLSDMHTSITVLLTWFQMSQDKNNKLPKQLLDGIATITAILTSFQVSSIDLEAHFETLEPQQDQRTQRTQPQQRPQQQQMHRSDMYEADNPVFEPARELWHRGYDEDSAGKLIRPLDQSIFNYDLEIGKSLRDYTNDNSAILRNPLKSWARVDPGWRNLSGREWYAHNEEATAAVPCHTTLTAALRTLLGTPKSKPLQIRPDLNTLNFSQVHRGLVACFVFDILQNKLVIDEWDNMKAMRAILPAIQSFGNERWEGMGAQVLREVRLRALKNEYFMQEILLHRERLIKMMKSYMAPLTEEYDNINSWMYCAMDLMGDTLKLCFYLHALGAKLKMIRPNLGDFLDSTLHEVDEGEREESFGEISRPRIRWVLRPGFIIEELGVDGCRPNIIKAKVMI